jgi:KDO2-lipid IV(A) lauroyltransferase
MGSQFGRAARVAKRLRHESEYALALGGIALFRTVPPEWCARLAVALADAAFLALVNRRAVAVENILRSSLGYDRRTALRLARASFRHFALSGAECLRMQALFADGAWRDRVHIATEPMLRTLAEASRGFVLACGHFGNWDVGAQVFAQYRPLVAMARPMDNPKVERLLTERRFYGRVRSIAKHGGDLLRMVDLLGRGEVLAIMIDQNAGRRGIVLDFLGRPASTQPSVALLPLITRAPLHFGYCVRTGPMAYEAGLSGPVECRRTGNRDADVRAILRELNVQFESLIRRHPEQYLWGHRRWRFR